MDNIIVAFKYDGYSESNSRCANSLQRTPIAIFLFFCLHSYNFYCSVAAMLDCIVQACSVTMYAISGHVAKKSYTTFARLVAGTRHGKEEIRSCH